MLNKPVFWVFLASCVYVSCLGNPFVQDDLPIIRDNVNVRTLSSVPYLFARQYFHRFGENSYRPLPTLSYIVNYHYWGNSSFGYHLLNLILHIGCGILVYLIGKFLYGSFAGFAAGVIFAMHPALAENISVASFNKDLFAAFFLLLSLYLYINDNAYIVALLSYALALLSKETALVFPLMIIAYHLCFRTKNPVNNPVPKPHRVFLFGSYCLLAVAYVFLRFRWMSNPDEIPFVYLGNSFYANMLTMLKTIPHYARALFLPFGYGSLCKFKHITISYTMLDKEVILSLIFMTIVVLGYLKSPFSKGGLRGIMQPHAFSLILIIFGLLPVMNLIPSLGMYRMADRYLYLPCAGAALALGCFWNWLVDWGKTRRKEGKMISIVFIDLVFGLAFSSWIIASGLEVQKRINGNENARLEAEQALKQNPRNPLALLYLATSDIAGGRFLSGAESLTKGLHALDLAGGVSWLDISIFQQNIGEAYAHANLDAKALIHTDAALYLQPFDTKLHYNKGVILQKLGRGKESFEHLEKSAKLSNTNSELEMAMAQHYFKNEDFNMAQEKIERAVWLKPDDVEQIRLLAHIYARKKQFVRAASAYRAALNLEPDNYQNYLGLGWSLMKSSQPAVALAVFQTLTIMEQPGSPGGYYGIANAASVLGRTKLALSALQKSIALGFSDINAIKQNEYLESIRSTHEYKAIVNNRVNNP